MQLMPTLTSFAVGVGAAALRRSDIKATPARTTLSKQWGTYAEGIAAALPYLSEAFRINILPANMLAPVGYGGAALFGDRIGRSVMDKQSGQALPGSPYAASRPYAMPYAAPRAMPYTQKSPSLTII